MIVLSLLIPLGFFINVANSERPSWLSSTFNENTTAAIIDGINFDEVFDNHLDEIGEVLAEYDPFKLLDLVQNPKLLPHKITMTDGWLRNLSFVKRTGTNSLKYADKKLIMDLNFGWRELAFDYKFTFSMPFIYRRGKFHGTVFDTALNIKMDIDFTDHTVYINSVDLTNIRGFDFNLEGSILYPFLNIIFDIFGPLFRDLARYEIKRIAIEMLKYKSQEINVKLGMKFPDFKIVSHVESKVPMLAGMHFHVPGTLKNL